MMPIAEAADGECRIARLRALPRSTKLTRRIIISLGLLLTLCLIGDAIVMLSLQHSMRELSVFVESHRIQSMRTNLVSAGILVESNLRSYLPDRESSREGVLESERELDASLRRCASCHHQPGVQSQLDQMCATHQSLRSTTEDLFATSDTSQSESLRGEALELNHHLVRQASETADRASSHLAAKSAHVGVSVRHAALLLFGTLVAVLIFGGIVAIHLRRRLVLPVDALLEGVERIRRGEPAGEIALDADEEFRALADGFGKAYVDLKTADERILQAEKLAVVGRVASGVAHEIVNPLASISSAVQLMSRESESGPQEEYLRQIAQAIERISRIVHDVQTFSQPVTTETHGRAELVALLRQAVALSGYDERSSNIDATCEVDPNVSAIHGDADRLLLVFTNIVFNALDAITAKGGERGWLAVTAERVEDEVEITFEDSGVGMSEELGARAYEAFFTTKAPGAGTGMGLWIAYQVIARHNGTIGIRSREGEGTTVTIRLPCDKPSEP